MDVTGSPTCGVKFTWADGKEKPEPGVFIRMLGELCRERGISLPMRGVRAYEPEQAVEVVKGLLGGVYCDKYEENEKFEFLFLSRYGEYLWFIHNHYWIEYINL